LFSWGKKPLLLHLIIPLTLDWKRKKEQKARQGELTLCFLFGELGKQENLHGGVNLFWKLPDEGKKVSLVRRFLGFLFCLFVLGDYFFLLFLGGGGNVVRIAAISR